MYVKRAGGVSSRAGTTLASTLNNRFHKPGLEFEYYTSEEISDIKFFSFSDGSQNRILACVRVGTVNLLYYDNVLVEKVKYQNIEQSVVISAPSPSDIKFTYTKDGVFITPSCSFQGVFPTLDDANVLINFNGEAELLHKEPFVNVSGTTVFGATGVEPFLPASYLVTAVLKDGTEEIFNYIKNATYEPSSWDFNSLTAGKIVSPTSEVSTFVKLELVDDIKLSEIRFFNLYRSSNALGGREAYYKLVGKQPYTYGSSNLTVTFNDYGSESLAETPPLDNSYYGDVFLSDAVNAVYYQQRLILGFSPFSQKLKTGEAVASKLGAPKQFISPIIFNETGAFTFSIPIQDGGPIVNWLSMDRLIAFTAKAVYVIRGGEQGVFTPTTINPLMISTEGCSSQVVPKMSNRRGYFINDAGTKLMAIEFGIDGNLTVFEASAFSEHLFNNDIKEIEVIGGLEDTIYALKTDGTLIQVTCTDSGAHGFSRVETSGEVMRIHKEGDHVFLLVNRNGVKVLERLEKRNDKERQEEIYADCTIKLGTRLYQQSSGEYFKDFAVTPFPFSGALFEGYKLNIDPTFPVDPVWDAGQIFTIRASQSVNMQPTDDYQIHFFYDIDGNTQTLRLVPDFTSEVATGDPEWPYRFNGYFLSDVPEILQDVKNQSISEKEKLARYSRLAPAFKRLVNTPSIEFMYQVLGGEAESYEVAAFADGEIISSPNNIDFPTIKIEKIGSDTVLDFGDYISYGYLGIPYDCEFETLDLETGGGRTLTDTKKLISSVGLGLMETRGGFAGIPEQTLENMTPITTREDESFNNQTKNFNGHIVVHIPTEWNEPGRVSIKHVDPSPISILSVYPKGMAGD